MFKVCFRLFYKIQTAFLLLFLILFFRQNAWLLCFCLQEAKAINLLALALLNFLLYWLNLGRIIQEQVDGLMVILNLIMLDTLLYFNQVYQVLVFCLGCKFIICIFLFKILIDKHIWFNVFFLLRNYNRGCVNGFQ